jgi:UDP-N-acetylmuramoyl-L-alanyl-D-glutamate--2,6-diaminopimelate ligase
VRRPSVPLPRVASVLRAADLLTGVHGSEDVAVSGVSQDSRRVRPGDLFLAWRGVDVDAHAHLGEAVAAGAVAAVVERHVADVEVPQLVVSDGRSAAALVADLVLGSPWRELTLVGVTGTNGKTTTALLIRHLLARRGPAAALGTLGLVESDGAVRSGTEGLTTPGPVQLSTWLRDLSDEGVTTVVMEASSHALDQRRLDGCRFRVAVFTNLSQDHLDYHDDLDRYRAAKLRLLELLSEDGAAVVNGDDPAWRGIEAPTVVRFRLAADLEDAGDEADLLEAHDLRGSAAGSSFRLSWKGETRPVALPLVGRFNVANALAAAGAALVLGLGLDDVVRGLADAPQVPGRLEVVVREPFTVVLDFAHTPDALANVLGTLRPLASGRLLVLFGAGGDRDAGKRPHMARVVARHADLIWLTSDNPRTEDPERVLDDLEAGLEGTPFRRQVDRRRAIHEAIAEARPGDLLLLAGKGHERYQVVGREKRPFDERVVVREAMAAREVA